MLKTKGKTYFGGATNDSAIWFLKSTFCGKEFAFLVLRAPRLQVTNNIDTQPAKFREATGPRNVFIPNQRRFGRQLNRARNDYPLVENGCIKCSSPRNDTDTDTDTDTVTETGFVCRWCDQDEAEKRAEELARSLG